MTRSSWFPALADAMPRDRDGATLIGRVWEPDEAGPTPVVIVGDLIHSLARTIPP